NMRTGKIRIESKKIKTIEVNTTVLVRGLDDKEAKNILGSALDYLNVKDRKITDLKKTAQPPDRAKISAPGYNQPDSYMSKLIIDLRDILENIRENTNYSRDLFDSIVDIHEILIEKNYANDDIMKLALDMITPFGIVENEDNSNIRSLNRKEEEQTIPEKKRIDLSI
ncbi:hypothetical protein ACFL6O_03835, partial [candidate division KSB1 bacterium]